MEIYDAKEPQNFLNKVPEITIFFWITKLLTTAMGESFSDFFVRVMDPTIAVAIGGICLVGALALQFSVRKYVAWIYWLTVVMVAIFGTMAADVLHKMGIPHLTSTIFFATLLIIIFALWYVSEKTLSIHSIYNPRREAFYWATVLTTFALGTAVGDLSASTMGLGYLSAGVLFAVLIAIIVIAHYIYDAILGLNHRHLSRNAVFAYWFAYVLTRPLGASFADWMGKAHGMGGLGYGDGTVSFYLTILIVVLVGYEIANQSASKTS